VRAYERAKGYVALRIALASQWLLERLRETSRRTYTGWLFVVVFLALPYVVLGGLWEHLRNAAERLWDDVNDIEWAAFTPSYWREHQAVTTLAFDGRLVAIDSQVTAGDLRYEEEKFYRTTDTTGRDLVVFGAGTTSHIQRAVRELSEDSTN
jgi:hypothetical protein